MSALSGRADTQIKFGRQLLDRPGTPTGQHRITTTSPRLRGDKMPRIAVGAVDHPLCARLIHFALRALGYTQRAKVQPLSMPMTGQGAVLNAAALERKAHGDTDYRG